MYLGRDEAMARLIEHSGQQTCLHINAVDSSLGKLYSSWRSDHHTSAIFLLH